MSAVELDRATDLIAVERRRRFSLSVEAGPDAGVIHLSSKDRVVLGTSDAADLRFTDRAMSRKHCEITITDGIAQVLDLESRNGTWLDGVPVRVALLRSRSVLTLGTTRVVFELGAPEHVAPVLASHESAAVLDTAEHDAPVIDPGMQLRVAREQWLAHFERRYLRELLKRTNNNVSAAARAAGVDRVHFHRLLRRAGLR